MPNISVGINENLVVVSTTKNDKGSLTIKVKQAGEVDPMSALSTSGSTNFKPAEKDFIIYPPSAKDFNQQVDTPENIMKKIAEVKDPLDHILQQYTTNSNIKWDPFAGTGINKSNLTTEIVKQEVVDKMYSNIVDQFISMMKPFVGENGKKLRWLLIRQSKAKHFPSLRRRFLETYPFVEPMDVPISKLKFSKFEVDNGLDKGDAVTGAQNITPEEKQSVNELFTAN